MKRKLISPNAKCRAIGCRTSVPPYGGYPGMPQSHCPRCGMVTSIARPGVPEFIEPLYPESDLWWRITEYAKALIQKLKHWKD